MVLFLSPNPILQWLTQWGKKKKKHPCHTVSYPSDLISCHPPRSSLCSRHKGLLAVLPTLETYFRPEPLHLLLFLPGVPFPLTFIWLSSPNFCSNTTFSIKSFLTLNLQPYLTIPAFPIFISCLICPHNTYCSQIHIKFAYFIFFYLPLK